MLLNIISILLTLGTTPDCDGFGVCILENRTQENIETCMQYDNCIEAEMEYESGELILIVSQKKLNSHVFVRHFTTPEFRVDKDYLIPTDVSERLGSPQNTIIPQGKYPITEENGKIVVRIKV